MTDEQKEVLLNLIGKMNYYESMAILCKTYEKEEDCEKARQILMRLYIDLEGSK
jgi:hypothetical protein